MDVKSTSVQSMTERFKMKAESQDVSKKRVETPLEIINKGVDEAKEQRAGFVSKDSLEQQVDSMNELLKTHMTGLKFNVHEELNRPFVQVVDKENNEVIKEIPSEQFLNMVASMLKHAGLIIDKRI